MLNGNHGSSSACSRADLDEMQKALTQVLRVELHAISSTMQHHVHAGISMLLKELRGDHRVSEHVQRQGALRPASAPNGVPSVPFELDRDVNGLRGAGQAREVNGFSEAKPPDLQDSRISPKYPEFSRAALQQQDHADEEERAVSKASADYSEWSKVGRSGQRERPMSGTSDVSSSTHATSRPMSGLSRVSVGSMRRHSSLKTFVEERAEEGGPASEGGPNLLRQITSHEQPKRLKARTKRAQILDDPQRVPPGNFPSKVHPPFGPPPPLPPLPSSPVELPTPDNNPPAYEDYGQSTDDDRHMARREHASHGSDWRPASDETHEIAADANLLLSNSMKDENTIRFRSARPSETSVSGMPENVMPAKIASNNFLKAATKFLGREKPMDPCLSTSPMKPPLRRRTDGGLSRRTVEWDEDGAGVSFSEEPFKVIVENEFFDYIMGLTLCLNAAAIGWEVDDKASNIDEPIPVHFKILEVVFCMIFTIELILRILAYKLTFLYRKDWQWNIFDLTLVVLQIAELITQATVDDPDDGGTGTFEAVSFLKILKFGRVVRLVRMVRLIPSLKSMVYLIAASLGSFFWTIMLMMLLIYGVAIYFTEVVTDYRKAKGKDADKGIVDSWGTLVYSILSLYQAILGGIDWKDLFDPIKKEVSSPLVVLLFLLYIAFATLVMLNLVTGVFVEGAQRIIRQDKDAELVKHVKKLFEKADKNDDAEITLEEFEHRINRDDKRMDEYFKAVDLNRDEARNLFKLLDHDNSGSLCADEFVHGCLRLKGPAKSVDLATLLYNNKNQEDRWAEHFSKIEYNLERLTIKLSDMNGEGPLID